MATMDQRRDRLVTRQVERYPVEHLAESLAEGIVVGHGDMPEFLFEPDDVEALLAYIAGLAN